MPNFTVLSEHPISMAELKQELARIKKRDGELNFRGQKTEEYLNYFVSYSAEASTKVGEELTKLDISRLKPEHITKLADILPATPEEVKAALLGYNLTIAKDGIAKIAQAIQDVLAKEAPIETAQPPKAAPEPQTKVVPKEETPAVEPKQDAAELAAEKDEKVE